MMTSATRETFIPTTYYILLVFFFGASQNDSAAGSEIGYVSRTFEKRIKKEFPHRYLALKELLDLQKRNVRITGRQN